MGAEQLKTDAAPFVASADPSVIAPLPDIEPLVSAVTAPPVVLEPAPMAEPLATAPTRRSRRSGQTGEQPVVPQIVVAIEPVEASVAPPTSAASPDAAPLETVLVAAEPFELLEPELPDAVNVSGDDVLAADDTEPAVETVPAASAPTAAEIDAFEAAARLFSFTGENPVQFAVADEEIPAADSSVQDHVAPRRNRGASFKRVTAASFSFGVMGVVGLLTVGMTTPVAAVAAPGVNDITSSLVASPEGVASVDEDEIQAYVTPTELQNATIERAENYSTVTMAQIASESGITNFSNYFVNDPNSAIQWPFAVGVPITYGYGMRSGRMHEGVDFTPGAGSPVQAIAEGVVRVSTDSGGAYGVHVIIDHVIDGQLVSSHYAHLQYGSRQVQVGDTVSVATVLGRTGNTGRSYGAHTHFELLVNGTTAIDPIPWLRQHAGG